MNSSVISEIPNDFTVVAVMAARNEADIIEASVGDLVAQGISVYLIDDRSTDGTVDRLSGLSGRGLVGVETTSSGEAFSLRKLMRRKEELAENLEAAWFINHDADEFRESPWPHLNLRQAIWIVDRLGYNAIDFEVLDFWPTHDDFESGDPREAFPFYASSAGANKLQIRCWKKVPGLLDLVSSGGHEAVFTDRRVFPIRFLLRHYPFRGQKHGEAKLFGDRRSRYAIQELEDGWHRQHDGIEKGATFIRDPGDLRAFDPLEIRLKLWLDNRQKEEDRGEPKTIELGEESLRRETALLGRELHERNLEIEKLRFDLGHAEGQVEALLRSWSWRLTAPLRAALKGIRGR